MLDRLDGAFTAQRRLVEDVSHELRNPVAVVQANVEAVLANDEVTAAERARPARSSPGDRGCPPPRGPAGAPRGSARGRSSTSRSTCRCSRGRPWRRRGSSHRARPAADPAPAAGPVVIADAQALVRAIGNLLSNAVRLARGGEVTVASGSAAGGPGSRCATRGRGSRRRTGVGLRPVLKGGSRPQRRRGGTEATKTKAMRRATGSAWPSPGRSSRRTRAGSRSSASSGWGARSSSGYRTVQPQDPATGARCPPQTPSAAADHRDLLAARLSGRRAGCSPSRLDRARGGHPCLVCQHDHSAPTTAPTGMSMSTTSDSMVKDTFRAWARPLAAS